MEEYHGTDTYTHCRPTVQQTQCIPQRRPSSTKGRLIVDQEYNKRNAHHIEDLGRLIVDQEYNKRNALHNEDLGRQL